jgi:hypothetical protein
MLEENDLKEYVEDVVPIPTDLVYLEFHKKREVKARQILLEFMKDHLIHHIVEKENSKDMYDYLVGIYQKNNTSRMFHLKNQL